MTTDKNRLNRRAVLVALLAVPLVLATVRAQDSERKTPPLRVLVPGDQTGKGTLAPMLREALELVGARALPIEPGRWAAVSPDDADFILLSRAAVPRLERASAAEIDALGRLVARGVHLVVVGAAAGALPDSKPYGRLIGRSPGSAEPLTSGREFSEVVVFVTDQKHQVTQCIPHLVFDRAVITASCAGRYDLASAARSADAGKTRDGAAPRTSRVLSIHRSGLGSIAVLALEAEWPELPSTVVERGRGERERKILATLVGRCMEWMGSRRVTLHLPPDLPLAASRLGADDTGALPGLKPFHGFYRGRQIARFMTFHGADWLVRPERELTERPDAVLDSLKLEPGSTVVDLGAGVGYFSERMARRVGPRGKVLAVDIQEEMLSMLKRRMEDAGIENVVPVLATATDPRLPSDSVDLVLMVDVYHELSEPAPVIARVRDALRKKGPRRKPGRLVLVEYRGEDPSIQIKPLHRMTVQQARAELEPAGLRWVETKKLLPHQHVIIFERASGLRERE